MSKKSIQISVYFLKATLLIGIGAIMLLTILWIFIEYTDFTVQIEREREAYISEKKAWLKNIVESTAAYIHVEYVQSGAITRSEVQSRVQEATGIAAHLLDHFGTQTEREQLEALIREALRPIRFFSGRGYFFAINIDGTEELYADKPELEGLNLSYMIDDQGRQVVPEMLELARNQQEGFYEYNWTKPGSDRNNHPKIAYLKLIPGLDWVIGAGEYLEDVERDQQQKTLTYLSTLTIEENGYIFGGTMDGISLLGPMVGQNMLETRDVNGVYIVKELIRLASAGGGFMEYVVPPFPDVQALPKLSYVSSIPEWSWYIGYGVYIDEISTQIAQLREELNRQILTRVLYILLLTAILVVGIMLTGKSLQKHFKADYTVFMNYFAQAAFEGLSINISSLKMEEYRGIATPLNAMVEKKNQLDSDLKLSLEEQSALLREVHHRVKNNFQTVASLLTMQSYQCEEIAARQALQTAHDRIYSMAAVHNLFYQSDTFSHINIRDFIAEITANVQNSQIRSSCDISMETDIEPFDITLERAIPLGLILNELITNSYKHAFTDRTTGKISIVIHTENGNCQCLFQDNGSGKAEENSSAEAAQGLGLELIRVLTTQLQGHIRCKTANGYRCNLSFPL
ncbi:MAG: cache domain-containing protein [Spirochaetes bacterium]|nr:cache domain-containing protein [Spirochaetota bacterium]